MGIVTVGIEVVGFGFGIGTGGRGRRGEERGRAEGGEKGK